MKLRKGLGLLVVMGSIGTIIACVLADPPPFVPVAPTSRPVIITDLVTPRLDKKVLAPSTTGSEILFNVAVEVDPTQTIVWRVFRDLDAPIPNPNFVASTPDDAGLQGQPFADAGNTIRNVGFTLVLDPQTASECHRFTFVVANGTFGFDPGFPSKPVAPPGGDHATWFYEPVSDCTYDEAGPPTDASTTSDGADE